MKIVFLSNFFNHHQKPLSDELYRLTDGKYVFIETQKMSDERKKMGWGMQEFPSYVISNFEDEEQKNHCQALIDEADVVIIGSAPCCLLKERLKKEKLTFYYSERIYKQKRRDWCKYPIRLLKHYYRFSRHNNLYLLCASAYTAADFAKTLCFIDKTYKWGYFPQTKGYDNVDELIKRKRINSILWCARFIGWKHPEMPVLIAKRLKENGYIFEMNLIGCGERQNEIKELIVNNGLRNSVKILGNMTSENVRQEMEKSEIFLFTSDRNEGWGAVLNESMNSACAVVANHMVGSVPFLVNDKENGFIYKDGDFEDLYKKVKFLLDNSEKRKEISKKAYETIALNWNAEIAAQRLIKLIEDIQKKNTSETYKEGPCSKAKRLKDNWYNR